MNNQEMIRPGISGKSTGPESESTLRLSDNAFYLIALAVLLKKMVKPGTLQNFLTPGKFAGLNNDSAD